MAVAGQINDDVDRFLRMELTQPDSFLFLLLLCGVGWVVVDVLKSAV